MSTDGVYAGQHSGMHVFPKLGCVDAACRSPSWTVQYTMMVLIPNDAAVVESLREDAQVISGHIRDAYEEYLMAGQQSINTQVTVTGKNHGYHVDAQVYCPSTNATIASY
jgi:hypothetical protein